MAKGSVTVQGIDAVIDDFNSIVEGIEPAVKKANETSLSKIESRMKINAQTMLEVDSGVMVRSIGHHVGDKINGVITSSVGVYIMQGVEYPKTAGQNRTYTAPMVAFFHESGVRPHSTTDGARLAHKSGRKAKGQDANIHGGFAPTPFLSSAFDAGSADIFEELRKNLNKNVE